MSHKYKKLLRNISYSFTANVVSLVLSIFLIAILPKILGVEEYGYWQLYIFYISFVGFFGFGWIDGVYLRYGGNSYNELDKGLFSYQFRAIFLFEIVICLIISAFAYLCVDEKDKIFVIYMTGITCVFVMPKAFFTYVLLATNRIKEHSIIVVLEKILKTFGVVTIILIGVREYRYFVFADILATVFALGCSIFYCKEIFFYKVSRASIGIREIFYNITVGSKLMFANIASLAIVGIIRFGIEQFWGVSTFGKVSLTLSISNFFMIFINAVSVAIFPMLRKTSIDRLPEIYKIMRTALMVPLVGILLLYYPCRVFFEFWLPKYADSFDYMAILFPVCLYESKLSMLVYTYLKALRKENFLLVVNMISVFISFMLMYFSVYILHELNLAIVSIVLIIAFRCIVAEIYLAKLLRIKVFLDNIIEGTMALIFILSSWYVKSWYAVLIYFFIYVVYLNFKRDDISSVKKAISFSFCKPLC